MLVTWRRIIAAVAACLHVHRPLGGIGMPRLRCDWHTRTRSIGSEALAASMAPRMTHGIDPFGPDRRVFESNVPPDKVPFSPHVLFNVFTRLSKDDSAAEHAALFYDPAVRTYRISDASR